MLPRGLIARSYIHRLMASVTRLLVRGLLMPAQHPVQELALVSEPLSLLHGRYGLDGSALRPAGCGVERAERDLGPDPVALLAGGADSGLGQCAEQGFDL